MVGDGGTVGQGMHAGQLATLASQLVDCKHRVVHFSIWMFFLIFFLHVQWMSRTNTIVSSQTILTVSTLLAAASSIIKAIQPDVRLLMVDESVKFVNELHAIL